MFVGRQAELKTLEKLYLSDDFEFAVVYGRRRVGKSSLLNEFSHYKDNVIFFSGIEFDGLENLNIAVANILNCKAIPHVVAAPKTFLEAFQLVFEASLKEKIVLIIDEYPYLARADKSLNSVLQMLIDKYKDKSKLKLIISGSSMSFMEKEVLSYKAPLCGRRTAQLKIDPFNFKDSLLMMPKMKDEDSFIIYSVLGGTPKYLECINTKLDAFSNIEEIFFDKSSFIFEEPLNLFRQEVREPSIYNAIVKAIADGASRVAEISKKLGIPSATTSIYLKNLIDLGIVKKENPYLDDNSKKSIYEIKDNLYKFYYKYIPGNEILINSGASLILLSRIKASLSEYLGKSFEEICKEYLILQLLRGKLPLVFGALGRWWGNDKTKKCQTEIDIMAQQDPNTALFAECKWTNEKVDQKVLETLVERSHLFKYTTSCLYLFSKSGFTKGCSELAKKLGNVYLVTFDEMMKEFRQK